MPKYQQSRPAMLLLLMVLLAVPVLYPRPAQADVDINVFYGALQPYGTWIDHGTYGRVWYPRGVPMGWRPYSDGHWEYTHYYGWTWVSDWEWGWAPFHYGRWAWDDWYGWVWLPGRVWAPAWVYWRYGGGYAAWAPMPPTAYWDPRRGLINRHFDYDRDLRPDCWVGVPERHLHERRLRDFVVEPRSNAHFLKDAKHFAYAVPGRHGVVNQGIPVKQVESSSGRAVQPLRLRELSHWQQRGHDAKNGSLAVYRPKMRAPSTGELRNDETLAVKVGRDNAARIPGRSGNNEGAEAAVPGRFLDSAPRRAEFAPAVAPSERAMQSDRPINMPETRIPHAVGGDKPRVAPADHEHRQQRTNRLEKTPDTYAEPALNVPRQKKPVRSGKEAVNLPSRNSDESAEPLSIDAAHVKSGAYGAYPQRGRSDEAVRQQQAEEQQREQAWRQQMQEQQRIERQRRQEEQRVRTEQEAQQQRELQQQEQARRQEQQHLLQMERERRQAERANQEALQQREWQQEQARQQELRQQIQRQQQEAQKYQESIRQQQRQQQAYERAEQSRRRQETEQPRNIQFEQPRHNLRQQWQQHGGAGAGRQHAFPGWGR